jgi:peptidoglycan hydrolase FlgJ
MDNLINQGLAGDIRNLDQLRQMGIKKEGDTTSTEGQQKALQAAARQFEAIFTQMWMKSMREANNELQDKDSPFNSSDTQFYQGMMDDQLAANVASGGKGSLADLIVKQLSPASSQSATTHSLNMPSDQATFMKRFAQADTTASNNTAVPKGVLAAERFVSQIQAQKLPVTTNSSSLSDEQTDQQRFVRQLLPAAKMVASKMGLSPVALIAQAALETGWGKHMMSNSNGSSGNNLFGVKAGSRWQGQKTTENSLEYQEGKPVMQRSSFRSYTSVVQSMQDYANLINGTDRYQQAKAVAHDPEAYFDALQSAGYATDPNYAQKLKQVLRSDALRSVSTMTEI